MKLSYILIAIAGVIILGGVAYLAMSPANVTQSDVSADVNLGQVPAEGTAPAEAAPEAAPAPETAAPAEAAPAPEAAPESEEKPAQ